MNQAAGVELVTDTLCAVPSWIESIVKSNYTDHIHTSTHLLVTNDNPSQVHGYFWPIPGQSDTLSDISTPSTVTTSVTTISCIPIVL